MRALVTGAAREGGIGQAIVARLQRDGMDVVTLDVEPGCTYEVDMVSGELPPLDDIDVLVCNAGLTTMFGAAHTMRLERWQRDLDVNLTGPQDIVAAWLAAMPKGEFVRTQDIAEAVAFFASPAAAFITGQELTVDGGERLNTRSVTRSATTIAASSPASVDLHNLRL